MGLLCYSIVTYNILFALKFRWNLRPGVTQEVPRVCTTPLPRRTPRLIRSQPRKLWAAGSSIRTPPSMGRSRD